MEKVVLERKSEEEKKYCRTEGWKVKSSQTPLIPAQEVRSPTEMKKPLGPVAPA